RALHSFPTRRSSDLTIDRGATYFPVALGTLVCGSVSLCVAGDGYNVFTATNPTGGASGWMKARVAQPDPNGSTVNALSCPSISLDRKSTRLNSSHDQ